MTWKPSNDIDEKVRRDWWERGEVLAEITHEPGLGWHSLRRKFAPERKHTPLRICAYLGGWKEPQTALKCCQRAGTQGVRWVAIDITNRHHGPKLPEKRDPAQHRSAKWDSRFCFSGPG